MSTHKNFDKVCVVITVITLLVAVLFMNGSALGIEATDRSIGYEKTLFDTSKVHTIDIVIDDWDAFIETCESEEYSVCSVVIDGDAVKNVAIRGKGNTSLSTVKTLGSERYSFKIEFDQYEEGKNYHGLDKLSLNNIIQDNTYMKDYLTYRLMNEYGVTTPLCSFAWITVNGEDWGLYLAVEGIEDSFLQRNYGKDAGELYKPDSMSFGGGGPGNGKNFNMEDFFNRDEDESEESTETPSTSGSSGNSGFGGFGGGNMPGFGGGEMPEGFSFDGDMPEGFSGGSMPGFSGSSRPDSSGSGSGERPERGSENGEKSGRGDRDFGGFGGFDFNGIFGGMGSSDVKLQYSDDDPDSYSNIFNNAKTDVNYADKKRLIEAIKKLNNYEDIENTVDVEEVIRYFVVHNYVCNGDSYTGSIIHNYYLHESDGQLSMIPWDYNLAYGTFQGADSTSVVNDPIDTPMSVSSADDRPMWGWIMSSEEYTEMYHEYFAEFLETVDVTGIIDDAYELIKPYVEKDPTAFCTYEEFETGVATLRSFCTLRTESVQGQLDGTIPSTDAGQSADSSSLIDASAITISDMGSQSTAGGGQGGMPGQGERPEMPEGSFGGFGGGNGDGSFSFPGNSSGGAFSFPGGGFGGTDNSNNSDKDGSNSFSFPGGGGNDSFSPSDFPGSFSGQSSAMSAGSWILVGICVILLLIGIAVVARYRHYN